MEFVFVFPIVIFQVSSVHFLEVVEIIRAFRVDAFVEDEMLTVFLWGEGMAAVGTHEPDRGSDLFAGDECLTTDFALILPVAAVVVIDIQVGSPAEGTDSIFGDGFAVTALNRFDRLTVFPLVVFKKELPVLPDERLDDGQSVDGEFLEFRGMGVIESPLLERDVSADKMNQPTVLLIKVLNCLK